MIRRRLALAGLLLTIFQQLPGAAFPRPSGHVNDFAQVLTDDDRAYLENFLRTLERDTTAEVVVVTVTSLDGMTIEEYANRLFADWGIGTKTKDNGVLLLVAPAERKVRIEVGYGLEGSLPDGLAGEIIRTAILPEFKQGNLRRGIGRGLDRISRVVRGDAAAVTAVTSAPVAEEGSGIPPAILVVPFFSIFVLLGGVAAGLGLRTRTIALLLAGGLFTVIPLFIAATMSPWSLAFLLPVELIGMAFGYARGQSDYWWRTLRTGSPGGTAAGDPGTWIMGGSDSSSSSGSNSGSDSSSSSSSLRLRRRLVGRRRRQRQLVSTPRRRVGAAGAAKAYASPTSEIGKRPQPTNPSSPQHILVVTSQLERFEL